MTGSLKDDSFGLPDMACLTYRDDVVQSRRVADDLRGRLLLLRKRLV